MSTTIIEFENSPEIVVEMSGQGPQGKTGNGISSIELLSTVGLVNTYRINFTNGEYYDFDVTDGADGAEGVGIVSIEKTGTVGLVDTYTITLSDQTTYTFTVSNGEKGDTGNGIVSITKTDTSGLVDTYTVLYTNGDTDTFTVTNGEDGQTGATGNGIASIEKTDTTGLVDTYTITYTNGNVTTFTVTNGNGIASIEKISTVDLVDTYRITYTDGNYFDYTVTNGASGASTWGQITGTLSDQTDLKTALDNKAPVILSSASGSIASFTDGASLPVSALSVGIDPVQDLHGYSNPWPAGGGKNLFQTTVTTQTINGKTFTVNSDGSITATNTSTAAIGNYVLGEQVLPAGSYKVNGLANGGASAFRVVVQNISTSPATMIATLYSGLDISFTLTETSTVRMTIICPSGDSSTYNVYPMIRDASISDATFAPYSNICPISGWDEAVVTRTGKNLLNPSDVVQGSLAGGDGTEIASTNRLRTPYIFVNGTVTISSENGFDAVCDVYDESKNFIRNESYNDWNSTPHTFTINGKRYIRMLFRKTNNATILPTELTGEQIELSSSSSTYEPYQGQTVTIDLDGTRYGGTLDALTGEMTVTHKMMTIDGDTDISAYSGWRFRVSVSDYTAPATTVVDSIYCDRLKTISKNVSPQSYSICGTDTNGKYILIMANSGITTTTDMSAWLAQNPITVVYPLATPLTVQLTPSQLSTLLGTNNIWSDTGDTSVEYRADSKLYIDSKIADANRKTREMVTTVTDQMKAPKNLTSGSLIIVNDDLYKTTANVASGATLTVGTNVTKLTLAEYIQSLL